MLPAPKHILEKARLARDPRFDGRFFVGAISTGVYCRPVCRVRMPAAENVLFYASAAGAMDAGFRPCLRCRREAAPGTPGWGGTSATVSRGLRLIQESALDDADVARLADRLGVTDRHLRRLFMQHVGATLQRVAETRRLLLAKQMLSETSLRITHVAMAAGYGSVRSFNSHIHRVFGRTPTQLRGQRVSDTGLSLTLAYREPFDWAGLLAFIERRATRASRQCRVLSTNGRCGRVQVRVYLALHRRLISWRSSARSTFRRQPLCLRSWRPFVACST